MPLDIESISQLPVSERAALALIAAPAIYLGAMAFGRLLKRRGGVRLGAMYQLFCIVIAILLALWVFNFNYPLTPDAGAPLDVRRELGSAATLLGALFLIALMRRFLWEIYFQQQRKTEIPNFLREVVALVVFLVAVLWVMGFSYHQTIPGLLAGSGIAAVILGIAMQDLLGNIISGIALEFGKPFKVGDWLMVEKYSAEVMEVTWRSTRLRTHDNISLEIPNSQLAKATVINLSYPTKLHAMRLRFGIDYAAAPNLVKEVLHKASLSASGVLSKPAPKAMIVEFADSALIYEIKFYLENHAYYSEVVDRIQTNVWYALSRSGIKIPFPTRTLQIEKHAKPPPQVTSAMRVALRQRPFFHCLSEEQVDQLFSTSHFARYGTDEKLIEQGAEGHSMFILMRGAAGVYVNRGESLALVATLQGGDYFGEMSLLTGESRTATVIAHGDCDVIEVGKAVFAQIVQENPPLLEKLSDLLAKRRLETEGVGASGSEKSLKSKEMEYKAGFLQKLYSIFEL